MTPPVIAALLRAPWLALLARTALVSAYLWGGLVKLSAFSAAVAELNHFGVEPAAPLAALTIVVELGGSVLIIFGRGIWLAAGALGVFTLMAAFVANRFWEGGDPAGQMAALNAFLEHIGLIGGFMLVAILTERQGPSQRSALSHE